MESPNSSSNPNQNQGNSKSQPPKLKTFVTIRKYLAAIGITLSLVEQPYPLNRFILLGFLTLAVVICSIFSFIVYDAVTFAEYTQSVYVASLTILILFVLLIFILKIEKLFELFNSCDNLVNTSKCISCQKNCSIGFANIFRNFQWHFSIKIFSIEANFHWNRSIWAKIDRICVFGHSEIDARVCSAAVFRLQLFHIFHCWCGISGIWNPSSHVVKARTEVINI